MGEYHQARGKADTNQLLRNERKRRGWSLADVAQRIDCPDPRLVGKWERGVVSPSPRYYQRLCDLFEKDAAALGLKKKEHILPLFWNVPYHPNPFFTGREEILQRIDTMLFGKKAIGITYPVVLAGLGGIGKTQIAIKYVYRHLHNYPHAILWVHADASETIVSEFIALAHLLNLPQKNEFDPHRIVEAVKTWFKNQTDWLLVFDNVEDVETIRSFLPSVYQGHILLTTRTQITGTFGQRIGLEKMSIEEGTVLLLRRSFLLKLEESDNTLMVPDQPIVHAIVEMLDSLPLALDQAAAYIEETHCNLADYLRLLQEQQSYLLKERGSSSSGHPLSVISTFSLSFDKLHSSHHRGTIELLALCSFLAPDAIPEEIIMKGFSQVDVAFQSMAEDELQLSLNAAIKELLKYSLIRRNVQTKTLSIHRLVQAVLKQTLTKEAYQQWTRRIIHLIEQQFPPASGYLTTSYPAWSHCERYLPHAFVCIDLIIREDIRSIEAIHLLQKVGDYLCGCARYEEEERLILHALELSRQMVQPEQAEMQQCLESLVLLYFYQGKYTQAITLATDQLVLYEQLFGFTHVILVPILDALGWIYLEWHSYDQAEPLLQRAIVLGEQEPDAKSATVAHCKLGLAVCWIEQRQQEKYEQAEVYLSQAYELYKDMSGLISIAVLYRFATLYEAQGKKKQAEVYFLQSLAAWEQAIPFHHPWTAFICNGIARFYLDQNELDRALSYAQRAVAMAEQTMKTDHPWSAFCSETLTLVIRRRNDLALVTEIAGHPRLETARGSRLPLLQDCEEAQEHVCSGEGNPSSSPSKRTSAQPPVSSDMTVVRERLLSIPTLSAPLIGRDQEVTAICHALQRSEVRLLTLFGIGGVGKTQLALQVALELRSSFPDGVYFISLATLRHPDLVVSTLAQGLGVQEREGHSVTELVISALREKHLLLVLDNFEQVIAAASHIQRLMVTCPYIKVMVTSRIVLRIPTEHTVVVSPLTLPDQTQPFDYEVLSQNAAITLFAQRAQAVRSTFRVTPSNVQHIAEICARLDGLPLAIELAAARSKSLPPQALLHRLSKRSQILATNEHAPLPHQQTLWKTLTWSYDLLDTHEQKLFRWLSVFAGGCNLEALETVFQAQHQSLHLLDLIESLIDKSLIKQVEEEAEEPRFVMLETVREYGQERLLESKEDERCRNAHAAYFLMLVERAEPHLRTKEQVYWLDILEQEYDNVREALSWLLKRNEIEKALGVCGAISWWWLYCGSVYEGIQWMEQAIAKSREIPVSVSMKTKARACYGASILAYFLRESYSVAVHAQESLALYRALGDKRGIAMTLNALGYLALQEGNHEAACECYKESIPLLREVGNTWHLAEALSLVASEARARGDDRQARELLEESLRLVREVGDRRILIQVLHWLGQTAFHQKDYEKAHHVYTEMLTLTLYNFGRKGDQEPVL